MAEEYIELTEYDLERYDRQIGVNGFGLEGQRRLRRAKVLVAGAGGLGFPVSVYLTAAGVGTIRIIDPETVELSNLNRQLLHWDKDIGRKKIDSALEKLQQINPTVNVEVYDEKITEENAPSLISGVDAVIDALDNYAARYALNSACIERRIPFFHGAVHGFMGQATTIIPGETACLRCIVPSAPKHGKIPVLGPVAGTIGSIQATEVIKYLVGVGSLLKGKLLFYDGLYMEFSIIEIRRSPDCPDCSKIYM
ncbi:MAG: HesA/MoeB/ThiF family protein [Candidatus Bathyarchaeia archaeon]|nr:HesA/MoeB/ThiF family protein [Candidatus Bathyarchaeota archaeon]